MKRTKYSNAVLDNPKNGGIHSARRLKSVQTMLTTHDLKKPVLYQFILSGKTDKAEYQATIKALVRHIRTKCRAEYLGAYEVGDEKGGLHCHCYVIIETADQIPRDLLDVSPGHFIARRIKRTGMSIKIEPPKAPMHGGAMFARMDTPAKLADCIEWCSYHVKPRSKDDVPGRETYFASEFASNTGKREAQRQKHRDALTKSSRPAPAPTTETAPFLLVGSPTGRAEHTFTDKEQQHETVTPAPRQEGPGTASSTSSTGSSPGSTSTSSGPILVRPRSWSIQDVQPSSSSSSSNTAEAPSPGHKHGGATGPASQTHQPIAPAPGDTMTPAEKYIATKYEEAVDLQLDLDALRLYLLAHGIKRTAAQLVHDLDETYGFYGYASSHPAPKLADVAEFDKAIDRLTMTQLAALDRGVYNCLTDVRQSYTSRSTA